MEDSCRSFLALSAGTGLFLLLGQALPTPIRSRGNPLPDHPERLKNCHPAKWPMQNKRAALLAHERELREATDKLLIKVQEFRALLGGTHTADPWACTNRHRKSRVWRSN